MSATHRMTERHAPATLLLLATGALNLAPALLVAAPERFPRAYGVVPESPATELLLRHRAVLLGLVGAALVAAAREPVLRGPALAGAAISKVSFLALVGSAAPTSEIRRVARADALALAVLAGVAVGATARGHRPR